MKFFLLTFILSASILLAQNKTLQNIAPNDIGIQFPKEIPQAGELNWQEAVPGLQVAHLNVIFHKNPVDRILLAKVDPDKFKLSVQCSPNPNMKYLSEWQKEFNAVVVINGSFYTRETAKTAYGEPDVPMIINGKRKGPVNYWSRHGAFLFEPMDQSKPKVKVLDYQPKAKVEFEKEGYAQGTVSFPTLVDFNGKTRAPFSPKKRATRSFIALDKDGKIVLGNTQGGFFSLHRLGRFLSSVKELKIAYALNLDGGPPANMLVKAGKIFYEQYGVWETQSTKDGQEIFYFTDKNFSRWQNPVVIVVSQKQ